MLIVFQFFQTVGYYGFASWVPTLMIAAGITTTLSLRYSFLIALAAPLGPLLAMSIADRTERKWQIVVSAICIAVFGLLFAGQRNPAWLVACGVMLTCSNNCMSFAFHAYQSELFPTRVRAQAVGFVYSWSRLSAIFSSFLDRFFSARFRRHGCLRVHRRFHAGRRTFDRHLRPAHSRPGAGSYFAMNCLRQDSSSTASLGCAVL